jgi:hypothetical protein
MGTRSPKRSMWRYPLVQLSGYVTSGFRFAARCCKELRQQSIVYREMISNFLVAQQTAKAIYQLDTGHTVCGLCALDLLLRPKSSALLTVIALSWLTTFPADPIATARAFRRATPDSSRFRSPLRNARCNHVRNYQQSLPYYEFAILMRDGSHQRDKAV